MIKSGLYNPRNKERLFSCKPWEVYKSPSGDEEIMITEDYVTAFSTFKTATITAVGTVEIVAPDGGGSLAVTDIMFSANKNSATTVTVRFTDGSNTEDLFTILMTDQPVTFPWAVKGRLQGWRDARLELVVAVADTIAFVTVTYMKLPDSLIFSEWDALR